MIKHPRKPGHNVVSMPAPARDHRRPARQGRGSEAAPANAVAGSPDDPRMREAMRLVEAFLAIEDEQGRTALITLAERLVSYDWVRKAQQR
jgi:hypothetical protein